VFVLVTLWYRGVIHTVTHVPIVLIITTPFSLHESRIVWIPFTIEITIVT